MKCNGIKMLLVAKEGKFILLLECILAVTGSLSIYAQSLFMENITLHITERTKFDFDFSSFLLILSFLLPLSSLFLNYLKNKFNGDIDKKWDVHVSELISEIPYEAYEDANMHNKIKQITDVNLFVLEYGLFLSVITTCINIFSYFIVLLNASVILAISFLIASPLVGYLSSKLAAKEYSKTFDLNNERRVVQYKSSILRTRDYAKEIRLFGSGGYLLSQWKNEQKSLDAKILKIRLKHGLLSALISKSEYFIATINLIVLLIVYINEKISLGTFLAISGQVFNIRVLSKIQGFAYTYGKLKEYKRTYSDLNASIFSKSENEKRYTKPVLNQSDNFNILLKNVSFKYPNSNELILKNINLYFEDNQKIAIVGSNGAGKTTLIKIILGLYRPTEGDVYVNGKNTKDMTNDDRSSLFSVVFQDFSKFCLTLNENLTLRDSVSDNQIYVKDFFDLSKIDDNIGDEKNAILGKEYGEGVDLSGGEWQRIAIARAFQKNSKVLLLDEPTASLDPIAEVKLYDTIDKINIKKENICIYITHRLGLTRDVDRIIVLEDGCIIEDGSFEKLMALEGYYYRFFQSQKTLYDWSSCNEKKEN